MCCATSYPTCRCGAAGCCVCTGGPPHRLQAHTPHVAFPSARQAVSLVEWPERLALAGPEQQPAEPLEITISILGQAEQAAVEQSIAQRRAAAASSGGSGGGLQAAVEAGDDDEFSSNSSGEDEEGGGDRRWRRVQLLTAGQRWRPRLQLLRRYLAAQGAEVGCYLE